MSQTAEAPKPVEIEIASIDRDPYVPQFTGLLTPQDETIAAKGGAAGVHLYDEIRRDPHAFAVLQKRSLEVASREWFVRAASERRADKRAAEMVEKQLKGLNFDRLTLGLMSAILKGYAVAEVVWERRDGVWWIAKVKMKKQRRFRFWKDGSLRHMPRNGPLDGETVPDWKFIVHRYSIDQDDDDPYGLGLGTVLFWPAWFKRQVLAHWLQATEKYSTPTIVATYQGQYDPTRQKQLLSTIRMVGKDVGIAVPDSVEVDTLEASNGGGGDVIEKLGRYLDELMSEAVLGETLSTNSGERGARSLGEVHDGVRLAIAKLDADLVCATINESVVRWIVDLNALRTDAGYPEVWRDFSETEDLGERVQRDKTIHEMGYEPAEPDYFDETYGGKWKPKAAAETPPPGAPAVDPTAAMERTAALFADPTPRPADVPSELAAQLDDVASPAIDAMIEAMRKAVTESASFAELGERLLAMSGEIDPADLAGVMEDAMIVADLSGRAEIVDGR